MSFFPQQNKVYHCSEDTTTATTSLPESALKHVDWKRENDG